MQDVGQIWYVGSANPGSKRHELMVRIKGAHRALTTCADRVLEKSLKVEEAQAAPPSPVSSLQNFFLAGVLCHKPRVQRLFTFDAFCFSSEHRSRLNELFAEGARVRHAQPRTEGFGFRPAGALGADAAKAADDGAAGTDAAGFLSSQRSFKNPAADLEQCVTVVVSSQDGDRSSRSCFDGKSVFPVLGMLDDRAEQDGTREGSNTPHRSSPETTTARKRRHRALGCRFRRTAHTTEMAHRL
jgi:hypothetical protein